MELKGTLSLVVYGWLAGFRTEDISVLKPGPLPLLPLSKAS